MKTKEGNKLIAEFMTDEPEILAHDLKKAGTLESMQYHSSWDWIMPVVEKIEDTHAVKQGEKLHYGHSFKIDNWEVVIRDCLSGKIRFSVSPASVKVLSKIDAVWQGVIGFIQWYNKNRK